MLSQSDPKTAAELLNLAEEDVKRQWEIYASHAGVH
jgi:hypothetical protein